MQLKEVNIDYFFFFLHTSTTLVIGKCFVVEDKFLAT